MCRYSQYHKCVRTQFPLGYCQQYPQHEGLFFFQFLAALWFRLSAFCFDRLTVRAIFICFTGALFANRQPWRAWCCRQNLRWVVVFGHEARGRVFPVPLAFCFPSSSIFHLLRYDKHFLSPRELPHRHTPTRFISSNKNKRNNDVHQDSPGDSGGHFLRPRDRVDHIWVLQGDLMRSQTRPRPEPVSYTLMRGGPRRCADAGDSMRPVHAMRFIKEEGE